MRRHTIHRADRIGAQQGRTRKVVPGVHQVPQSRNRRKPGKHDRRVVHGIGLHRERAGHGEDDNGEEDPYRADAVDEDAPAAERVRRVLDGDAALGEVDKDGDGVGGGEADGADAGEAVEGGRGAKVDAAEEADDGGGQDERPDGHVEALADAAPELVAGNRAVAGERVGAARGGGQGADAGKHEDAEDEEEQAEAAGRGAGGVLEDDADGLAAGLFVGLGEERGHFGDDEEQRDEVEEAGDAGGGDGEDNGLGDLSLGVLDLFAHGGDHAVASEDVGGCVFCQYGRMWKYADEMWEGEGTYVVKDQRKTTSRRANRCRSCRSGQRQTCPNCACRPW